MLSEVQNCGTATPQQQWQRKFSVRGEPVTESIESQVEGVQPLCDSKFTKFNI